MKVKDFVAAEAETCRTCDGEVVEPDAHLDYVQELETDNLTARELLAELIDEVESILKKDNRIRNKEGAGFLGPNQRRDLLHTVATVQEFLDQFASLDLPKKETQTFYA